MTTKPPNTYTTCYKCSIWMLSVRRAMRFGDEYGRFELFADFFKFFLNQKFRCFFTPRTATCSWSGENTLENAIAETDRCR